MRRTFSFAASFFAGLIILIPVIAQTPASKQPETPKQISGGVLNGKAAYLPKPNYPAEAKAAGAAGAVTVQVVIDEEGNVAAANAVSGHPLLREAAVEAAHSARFSPTTLNGQPVKVSGVITYNFVTDLSPVGLGYELAFAERTGAFAQNVYPESLASQLPAGWAAERQALSSIAKPGIPEKGTDSGRNYSTADAVYAQRKLSSEDVVAVRRLQADIDVKYRGDQNKQWAFKVGRALGKLAAEVDQDYQFRANTSELEQMAASAPPSVPEVELKRLMRFIDKCKSTGTSIEERRAVVAEALMLRAMRV